MIYCLQLYLFFLENSKTLESIGPTEIITAENYIIKGSDIVFDDLNGLISSNKNTTITDPDKNTILRFLALIIIFLRLRVITMILISFFIQ